MWVCVSFPVCWHLTATPWTCITQSYLNCYTVQCLHAYLVHGKARKIFIFVIKKERSSDRRGKIVTVMQLSIYSINMHVCIPDFSKQ